MPTATARTTPTTTPMPTTDPLWLTAAEVEDRFGIPAGTIRSQASRGRLHARGKDNEGRSLYATADIRTVNRIPAPETSADMAARN